jgi:hypothetical protein
MSVFESAQNFVVSGGYFVNNYGRGKQSFDEG